MAALAHRFQIPVFEQYATGAMVFQDQNGAVQRGRGYASMEGSYRLAGGIGSLIDALAGVLDTANVLTGTRLLSVDHSEAKITAHLVQNGAPMTIKAQRVVLAAPPRVIAETVSFQPDLDPAHLRSLKSIPTWMAGQAKIIATYDEPHWRLAGLSGDAMSQRGPMVEIHDASPIKGGPYALFGFVGVPADARAANKDDVLQLAKAQLAAMFGPQMATPNDLILQDWAGVPEIAQPQDRQPLREHPVYGLPPNLHSLAARGLYFGATETATEFGGFLEGALEAAERIANTIT
jgi:monoamine oxidase